MQSIKELLCGFSLFSVCNSVNKQEKSPLYDNKNNYTFELAMDDNEFDEDDSSFCQKILPSNIENLLDVKEITELYEPHIGTLFIAKSNTDNKNISNKSCYSCKLQSCQAEVCENLYIDKDKFCVMKTEDHSECLFHFDNFGQFLKYFLDPENYPNNAKMNNKCILIKKDQKAFQYEAKI